MILNEHPGYDVIEESGKFYPIRLIGGAGYPWNDEKGRHLSNVERAWGVDGVAGNPFAHEDGSLVWFENLPHTVNFLNKWVRVYVGYNRAWTAWTEWMEHLEKQATDIAPIVDRLQAERDRYLTISRAYESAAELVKLINAGEFSEDHARTVFKMVIDQAAHEEVKHLYTGLVVELGLE